VSEENMAGETGAQIDLILWMLFIVGRSSHRLNVSGIYWRMVFAFLF